MNAEPTLWHRNENTGLQLWPPFQAAEILYGTVDNSDSTMPRTRGSLCYFMVNDVCCAYFLPVAISLFN